MIKDRLLKSGDEIDDGDVLDRNAEGHAGELAIELGVDLADGLGSAGGRGDDVVTGPTATTPVLARRSIDGLLGGSHGVHGRHESLLNTKGLIENLHERGETVGRARSV